MVKNIFSGNIDINKTAYLNWRMTKHENIENMIALAEGYLYSAIALAKECINFNEDKKADILIFPILTNANHGIELYLKSLIWTLNKLNNSVLKIEGSHNIKQMYQTVRIKIESYKDAEWLKHLLFALISKDGKKDNMDFSRYPINNKYENHFYINKINNVEIDLDNFIKRFEQIKESLDERASYFYYQELKGEW